MTTLTETFDGGTDGAAVVAGGNIVQVGGSSVAYSAAGKYHGALGIALTDNGAPRFTVPAAAHSGSIYWHCAPITSGSRSVASIGSTSNTFAARIRQHSSGQFDIATGAGGVIANGTSATSWTAGQWYRIDYQCDTSVSGTMSITIRIYTTPDGATPAETLGPIPVSTPILAQRLSLNASGTTGYTNYADTVRLIDGLSWFAAYAPTAAAGTWIHSNAGAQSSSGFTVTTKIAAGTSARLAVSTDPGLASPTYVAAQTPDSAGYVKHATTGLTAATQYYYAVTDTPSGGAETQISAIRKCKTYPPAGVPRNFTVNLGACITNDATDDSLAIDRWVSRNADVNVFTGDFHYHNPTGTDVASHLGFFEQQIANCTNLKVLCADTGIRHCGSDHDVCAGDNEDSNTLGAAASIAARQQLFPFADLADTNSPHRGLYQDWIVGRVHFVMLDIRNLDRSPGSNTDDASKTMLGAVQLAWLKAKLISHPEAPLKIIISDVQWMGAADIVDGKDKWPSYTTERQVIIDYIAANRVLVDVWHGDAHGLGYASRTANTWGGFPVICAAPMHNVGGGLYKTLWSQYYWGNPTGSACRLVGEITFTDDGAKITRTFSGYNAALGAEVVSGTDTWDTGTWLVWDGAATRSAVPVGGWDGASTRGVQIVARR